MVGEAGADGAVVRRGRGDPAAAQLVARIGAQAVWAKITEGLLGEPLTRRATATDVEVVQRLAERSGVRFVVPGEEVGRRLG